MDHREALAARVGPRAARDREVLIEHPGESEPIAQRGREQQPGIRHAVVIIRADLDAIERARLRHQEGAPLTLPNFVCGNRNPAGHP